MGYLQGYTCKRETKKENLFFSNSTILRGNREKLLGFSMTLFIFLLRNPCLMKKAGDGCDAV